MPDNRRQKRLDKGFHGKRTLFFSAGTIAKGKLLDKKAAKKAKAEGVPND